MIFICYSIGWHFNMNVFNHIAAVLTFVSCCVIAVNTYSCKKKTSLLYRAKYSIMTNVVSVIYYIFIIV